SNDDFADSSTNPGGPEFNGLSDKGRALVAEANRLGLIIDLSHAS
ncbi:MAG: membrane dipeptidase, partial [Xanthomonadales bacterium]|nr:membrane dipeptidase [Xanthomonadales bacterium]